MQIDYIMDINIHLYNKVQRLFRKEVHSSEWKWRESYMIGL